MFDEDRYIIAQKPNDDGWYVMVRLKADGSYNYYARFEDRQAAAYVIGLMLDELASRPVEDKENG